MPSFLGLNQICGIIRVSNLCVKEKRTMLAYKNRFHGHGSLRFVYANGKSIRSQKMVVKYTTNPKRVESRFSVVVSKKVLKSAVGRNRIRRRIYEIVRKELPRIDGIYDVAIIIFSKEVKDMPHKELKSLLVDSFKQADFYCNK